MEPLDRLTNAIDAALDAVSKNAPTSVIVRAALRVATLRQDPLAEWWLGLEMMGLTGAENVARSRELEARLTALVGADEARILRERAMNALVERRRMSPNDTERILGHSVASLEAHQASMREIVDEPISAQQSAYVDQLLRRDRANARATLAASLVQQADILERVKDAAYQYVLEAEAKLLIGDTVPDAVARGRAFVVAELSKRAPEALEALQSAEHRAVISDREALSHGATSCRRAIKNLADALYPASEPVTGDDGVTRILDDEHYRNRLLEYVRSRKGRSTHADVLASNLVAFGTRLKSLDDLTSKGVHGDASRAELESCITWLYMLAADLLRVDQESEN